MPKKIFCTTKFIALLLVVCITLTLLFSSLFIIANAQHTHGHEHNSNCNHDECSICDQLHLCSNQLNKLRYSHETLSFSLFSCLVTLPYDVFSFNQDIKENTPVELKVKLNN